MSDPEFKPPLPVYFLDEKTVSSSLEEKNKKMKEVINFVTERNIQIEVLDSDKEDNIKSILIQAYPLVIEYNTEKKESEYGEYNTRVLVFGKDFDEKLLDDITELVYTPDTYKPNIMDELSPPVRFGN